MKAHVLSVGQCVPDDTRLGRTLAVEADAHMDRAATLEEAMEKVRGRAYDLVMVNRILDGDGSEGMAVVDAMVKAGVRVMLVSDYREAQVAAVARGAVAGFGKSALGTPEVGQLLRQALRSESGAGFAQQQQQ